MKIFHKFAMIEFKCNNKSSMHYKGLFLSFYFVTIKERQTSNKPVQTCYN